jgi:hypothetical protein
MTRRDKPMSEELDGNSTSANDIELSAYESPRLMELGDIAEITAYSVSVRVP